MVFRLIPRLLFAAAFVAAASPVIAQTVHDAEEGKLPLSIGGGASNFDPDFAQGPIPDYLPNLGKGQGRMWGATAWVDVSLPWAPSWLHGVGIEGEYRSTFAGGSAGQSSLKETTVGGGVTYTYYHWRSFRPYGKYIFNYGTASFVPIPEAGGTAYSQDSRNTNEYGGGVEVRCTSHVWARAEYDYESWQDLLGGLRPQGFTVGAMYNFRKSLRR
jgi:opacity protein-like surface antigen